mmetsp:Transcript_28796/g.36105  ORF Transcript_28796/g.36105 Transcript_28796/m.36105 type:complete len:230 (+) Transcript_28796:55-744(+)
MAWHIKNKLILWLSFSSFILSFIIFLCACVVLGSSNSKSKEDRGINAGLALMIPALLWLFATAYGMVLATKRDNISAAGNNGSCDCAGPVSMFLFLWVTTTIITGIIVFIVYPYDSGVATASALAYFFLFVQFVLSIVTESIVCCNCCSKTEVSGATVVSNPAQQPGQAVVLMVPQQQQQPMGNVYNANGAPAVQGVPVTVNHPAMLMGQAGQSQLTAPGQSKVMLQGG